MKYFDLYSSYPDPTITAAWDSQVKETDKTPWFADTLTESEGELFLRFAACYAQLCALPRGARRALQRRIARSTELAAILPEYLQHRGRRLQHRMAWSLAGAALLLALGQGVATAATITVTTSNPNIEADGQCSLIEAIVNANNDAATFPDCAAGSGADTIVLPANANVTLSAVYPNGFSFGSIIGLPVITSRITIEGNGATISRQANAPGFSLVGVGFPGDLTLEDLTLSGGSAGVFNSVSGTLSIKKSSISGNTGSGVYNFYGDLTIENSTISGNGNSGGSGGGIYNYAGSVTIANSTISGNIADTGGGIFNSPGCFYLPFFGCEDATVTLKNSVIAGNQATVAPEIQNIVTIGASTVTANNFNLFGANSNAGVTGFTPGPNDLVPSVSLAQILGPLQNNGGPTNTHALVANSPAIDAGNPSGCKDNLGALLLKDQRGFRRNVDGNNDGVARCDIGAVEFGAAPVLAQMDFDGDGKSDLAIYRDGAWFFYLSSDGKITQGWWGGQSWIPVPADYDGDGIPDVAVYNSSVGVWSIIRSSDGGNTVVNWGGPLWQPVPADYDGDGKTDIAVYNSSVGVWSIIRSSDGGNTVINWGGPLWQPVPADFDGDGKTDIAVYNSSVGVWSIIRSSDGGNTVINWGGPLWQPVPADFDGDGKTDIAVYNSSVGVWSIIRSSDGGNTVVNWGGVSWEPVPADYDGDGKADIAVYYRPIGLWSIIRSSNGGNPEIGLGGAPQDVPLTTK